jgi:hypothetical protein
MSPAYSEGRQGTARRTGSVWPSTISTSAGWLKIKNIVFFLFVKEIVMSNFMKTGRMQGTQFSLTYCPFVFVDYFKMNFFIFFYLIVTIFQ